MPPERSEFPILCFSIRRSKRAVRAAGYDATSLYAGSMLSVDRQFSIKTSCAPAHGRICCEVPIRNPIDIES